MLNQTKQTYCNCVRASLRNMGLPIIDIVAEEGEEDFSVYALIAPNTFISAVDYAGKDSITKESTNLSAGITQIEKIDLNKYFIHKEAVYSYKYLGKNFLGITFAESFTILRFKGPKRRRISRSY